MQVGLSLSEGFLASRPLVDELMAVLAETKVRVVILEPENDEDHLAHHKLKLVCSHGSSSSSSPGHSVKIWTSGDVMGDAQLAQFAFNVILRDRYWGAVSPLPPDNCNSILVGSVQQIGQLIEQTRAQLQKRCKMEVMLRRTHAVSSKQHYRSKIRSLAVDYAQYRQNKQLKVFHGFMVWNTRTYLRVIGMAWAVWMISHHESQINQANQKIVKEGFFKRNAELSRLRTCFAAWKAHHMANQERRR